MTNILHGYDNFRRQTHRLTGYDYALPGYYYVTICSKRKFSYFGLIKDNRMLLNELGQVAKDCWRQIPDHYPNVRLGEFIVMPNHIHGILLLNLNPAATKHSVPTQNFASVRSREHYNKFGPQSKNLSAIVRGYKVAVKKYAVIHNLDFFWQSRFYDRIIRDEGELNRITSYMKNNPYNWDKDRNYSQSFDF